jgi:hypothetical protein
VFSITMIQKLLSWGMPAFLQSPDAPSQLNGALQAVAQVEPVLPPELPPLEVEPPPEPPLEVEPPAELPLEPPPAAPVEPAPPPVLVVPALV